MITAGIDCGAKNTKTVILKDGRVIGNGIVPTGFDLSMAVQASMAQALTAAAAKKGDIERIAGSGSGKDFITIAEDSVNEIKAISRAAHFYSPGARTVIDVGAEESRVVKIDDKGNPVDFAINEKCAAGAGAFIEAMSRALEVSLSEVGSLCLQSEKEIQINAQCTIFAESEVIGLIHSRTAKPDISRAIHDAIAGRIASMTHRIGVSEEIVLLGGVACNPGFVAMLKRRLTTDQFTIPDNPEFGAAVGAALVAAEYIIHGGRK